MSTVHGHSHGRRIGALLTTKHGGNAASSLTRRRTGRSIHDDLCAAKLEGQGCALLAVDISSDVAVVVGDDLEAHGRENLDHFVLGAEDVVGTAVYDGRDVVPVEGAGDLPEALCGG